jgi:rod shape-determining protein MreC
MPGTKNILLNKKNSVLLKFLIGAAALLFFLAILNFFNAGIKNVFYILSSPIEKTFWSAGESASGFLSSLSNAGFLSKENESLKNENQKLLSEIVYLQAITNANQAQSEASLACQNASFEMLMAGVVGSDSQDMLSINKGSNDGILEGMPVINQQNVLFGKIFKVYKNFSEVMLISNKNSVINVEIQQSDATKPEIEGVVKGKGGLDIYLDLIPIDDTISQNDVLITSALEGTFPKNLLVGKIVKVEKNDQNPHQQAEVQPFFNISADNLFVITNYKK